METLGLILVIVGALVAVGGYIWFLGVAFSEGPAWGLLCFFLPIVSLIFLAIRPAQAWKPTVTYLSGVISLLVGASLMGSAH